MDRRYQVFISSTFTDLIDERREVIEALLEMDAIPAGMELFAAGNTDQWTLIRQVIDQSDYYIVIVGGRYGSTTEKGISYTEMEYDYALERGIPVMGFTHRSPETIPAGLTELDAGAREKLDAFRGKVRKKIVKDYSTAAELGGVVSRGLIKLQRESPRQGWVRGDMAMTAETEARISEMRAELAELRQAAAERVGKTPVTMIEGLASGADPYTVLLEVKGTDKRDKDKLAYERPSYVWTIELETFWNAILQAVGPLLMNEANEAEMSRALLAHALEVLDEDPSQWPNEIHDYADRRLANVVVGDVIVQLFALGIITHGTKKRTISDKNRYWVLTSAGQDQVMKLRATLAPSQEDKVRARHAALELLTVPSLREYAADRGLVVKGRKADYVAAILAAENDGA